ncbi:MAG TPA: argininosuccinate lyase [Spirochaetota bacterium]|nr:argininosuccinate lyase [Spirochaetota bacterium]HSA14968.1 argininosuccinate lyase [Spirochaetota bacterium]
MGGKKEKKLWGGRFSEGSSSVTEKISSSIQYDSRLYRQDIRGSVAHARMLNRIGILNDGELAAIVKGLGEIMREIEAGSFEFKTSREDIHMNIEAVLTERIGDAGRKLHTARSRNDQVALDVRLYIRDEAGEIEELLKRLVSMIAGLAEKNAEAILPGYTHMQVAQPVRLSHHLLAYAWQLLRDMKRLAAARDAAMSLPLGSGALAGLNYPTDREFLREELGFTGIVPNSMDAVSDRDFVLDFLYFAAVLGTHLSRFCEELVLWSTSEFAYIRLADGVTTGSSIMPQKRNPDVAELIRGKSGRLLGNLVSLFTLLKGLPMTYNRDMQEDKEPLFDSVDTVKLSLEGMIEMLTGITFNAGRMKEAVYRNFSTATDLADYLARKGVPFRNSHEIVGSIVRHCEQTGADFFSMDAKALREFSPVFEDDIADVLNPEKSTERKLSPGGTSRAEVMKQIEAIRKLV